MAHAGTENGNLICTYNNFADYGVRRSSIAVAIRQLEYMGFIRAVKGWACSRLLFAASDSIYRT